MCHFNVDQNDFYCGYSLEFVAWSLAASLGRCVRCHSFSAFVAASASTSVARRGYKHLLVTAHLGRHKTNKQSQQTHGKPPDACQPHAKSKRNRKKTQLDRSILRFSLQHFGSSTLEFILSLLMNLMNRCINHHSRSHRMSLVCRAH